MSGDAHARTRRTIGRGNDLVELGVRRPVRSLGAAEIASVGAVIGTPARVGARDPRPEDGG